MSGAAPVGVFPGVAEEPGLRGRRQRRRLADVDLRRLQPNHRHDHRLEDVSRGDDQQPDGTAEALGQRDDVREDLALGGRRVQFRRIAVVFRDAVDPDGHDDDIAIAGAAKRIRQVTEQVRMPNADEHAAGPNVDAPERQIRRRQQMEEIGRRRRGDRRVLAAPDEQRGQHRDRSTADPGARRAGAEQRRHAGEHQHEQHPGAEGAAPGRRGLLPPEAQEGAEAGDVRPACGDGERARQPGQPAAGQDDDGDHGERGQVEQPRECAEPGMLHPHPGAQHAVVHKPMQVMLDVDERAAHTPAEQRDGARDHTQRQALARPQGDRQVPGDGDERHVRPERLFSRGQQPVIRERARRPRWPSMPRRPSGACA